MLTSWPINQIPKPNVRHTSRIIIFPALIWTKKIHNKIKHTIITQAFSQNIWIGHKAWLTVEMLNRLNRFHNQLCYDPSTNWCQIPGQGKSRQERTCHETYMVPSSLEVLPMVACPLQKPASKKITHWSCFQQLRNGHLVFGR